MNQIQVQLLESKLYCLPLSALQLPALAFIGLQALVLCAVFMLKRHIEDNENLSCIPIAKRLKSSADIEIINKKKKSCLPNVDLSSEIARLEAELQEGSSDTSSSDSDKEDEEEEQDILKLSKYKDEIIPKLASHLLPKTKKVVLQKPVGSSSEQARRNSTQVDLKGVRFSCKICVLVAPNLEEFNLHMQSKKHLREAEAFKEATYCKLCHKQFTSLDQLEEHKGGKWHKQRVETRTRKHTPKLCYDFLRGSCKRGNLCLFSHKKSTKTKQCFDFLSSKNCRLGDRCVFLHELKP